MIASTVFSILSILCIAAGLALFLAGALIDKGHRNNAVNSRKATVLVRCAIVTTVLSWVFSAVLAIIVLACGV